MKVGDDMPTALFAQLRTIATLLMPYNGDNTGNIEQARSTVKESHKMYRQFIALPLGGRIISAVDTAIAERSKFDHQNSMIEKLLQEVGANMEDTLQRPGAILLISLTRWRKEFAAILSASSEDFRKTATDKLKRVQASGPLQPCDGSDFRMFWFRRLSAIGAVAIRSGP